VPKDTTYYNATKSNIDKTAQNVCRFCGNPANIKIGIWDRVKVMTYDDEQGWRILFICQKCNEKEKCVNFETVWNIVGY
jgi:hypothetical protein